MMQQWMVLLSLSITLLFLIYSLFLKRRNNVDKAEVPLDAEIVSSPLKRNRNIDVLPSPNEKMNERETREPDAKSSSEKIAFSSSYQWRCACENGFLPPGLLKNLGGAEAMLRMGTGQCFHKSKQI